MKNNHLTRLCVLLGFLFCALKALEVSAQPPQPAAMREMQKNAMKQAMRSLWTGDNTVMTFGLMQQDDFREGIGVSKEQMQKMQDAMRNMNQNMMNEPQFKSTQEEIMKLIAETPDGAISPETQTKIAEMQTNLMNVAFQRMSSVVDENVTPEQKQKIKEFQISTMSEIPIVSPNMFEALHLSNEQKQQLDEIKKKMEPEFEKNLDSMVNFQSKFMEKFQDEISDSTQGVTDPEELKKILQDVSKRVKEKYPELKQMETDVRETGKAFANTLKFQMFDVLTDEQMERMAQLIDNPPDYVKKIIGKIRKETGQDDESTTSGPWKPNLNSWKPGDPIPEEYLEHRKKRFPSKK